MNKPLQVIPAKFPDNLPDDQLFFIVRNQANDPLILDMGLLQWLTAKRFGADLLWLYICYAFLSKKTGTGVAWERDERMAEITGWGVCKTKKVKSMLIDYGLITPAKQRDPSGKLVGWGVEVNVFTSVNGVLYNVNSGQKVQSSTTSIKSIPVVDCRYIMHSEQAPVRGAVKHSRGTAHAQGNVLNPAFCAKSSGQCISAPERTQEDRATFCRKSVGQCISAPERTQEDKPQIHVEEPFVPDLTLELTAYESLTADNYWCKFFTKNFQESVEFMEALRRWVAFRRKMRSRFGGGTLRKMADVFAQFSPEKAARRLSFRVKLTEDEVSLSAVMAAAFQTVIRPELEDKELMECGLIVRDIVSFHNHIKGHVDQPGTPRFYFPHPRTIVMAYADWIQTAYRGKSGLNIFMFKVRASIWNEFIGQLRDKTMQSQWF